VEEEGGVEEVTAGEGGPGAAVSVGRHGEYEKSKSSLQAANTAEDEEEEGVGNTDGDEEEEAVGDTAEEEEKDGVGNTVGEDEEEAVGDGTVQ
jgi:hypothetical protein